MRRHECLRPGVDCRPEIALVVSLVSTIIRSTTPACVSVKEIAAVSRASVSVIPESSSLLFIYLNSSAIYFIRIFNAYVRHFLERENYMDVFWRLTSNAQICLIVFPVCLALRLDTFRARFLRDDFLRGGSGERREKERSGEKRTIRALIARRGEKIHVPAVSSSGLLTSADLPPVRGAGSHAFKFTAVPEPKINSSARDNAGAKSRRNRRRFVLFSFPSPPPLSLSLLTRQRHRRDNKTGLIELCCFARFSPLVYAPSRLGEKA